MIHDLSRDENGAGGNPASVDVQHWRQGLDGSEAKLHPYADLSIRTDISQAKRAMQGEFFVHVGRQ